MRHIADHLWVASSSCILAPCHYSLVMRIDIGETVTPRMLHIHNLDGLRHCSRLDMQHTGLAQPQFKS